MHPFRFPLLLAALTVSLPLLVPVHRLPVPSFESEWLAVMLGLAALLAAAFGGGARLRVPLIAAAPLALAAVAGLQYAAGLLPYGANALLAALLLAWAALVACLGRTLADQEPARFWRWEAWALAASGTVNALAGLAQFAHLDGLLPMLVAPHPHTHDGVWGNLAQQNHFALHMALALAGVAYLWRERALNRFLGAALASALLAAMTLLLLGALVLSGSRTGLLLALWLGAVLALHCPGLPRRVHWRLAAVGMALLLALAWAARAGLLGWSAARIMAFTDGAGPRLFFWRHALGMFAAHPLLGIGIDGFGAALVDRLGFAQPVYGVDQYAHNLPLQLLATTGLAGLLAVTLPVIAILRAVVRMPVDGGRLLAWSALGMLAIHSLLEQPLHYAYFLAIAALFCGAVPQRAWTTAAAPVRLAAALLAVGGMAVALRTGGDYLAIQGAFYRAGDASADRAGALQVAGNMKGRSLLAPLAELAAPEAFVPARAPMDERLRQSARRMRFAPVPETLFGHADLLAQAGQSMAAQLQLRQAVLAYPDSAAVYLERFIALGQSNPKVYGQLGAYAVGLGSHLQ